MKTDFRLRVVSSIGELPAAAWNKCAGGSPLLSHEFLSALEDSGSAARDKGWGACHILMEDGKGQLLACAPAYLKAHSYGEYVFDHAFADALIRTGEEYYPKLQLCVPFTPVTGARLLISPDAPKGTRELFLDGIIQVWRKFGVSSLHISFMQGEQAKAARKRGLFTRLGCQYHWHNRGYRDFDDFLASLTARRRKAIRKERAQVARSGLDIGILTGKDLTEAVWDSFFAFYMDTGSRKWGRPYLTRECFSLLGERMADKVLLVLARREGRPVAGALHILASDALYGRYWGCTEHHPFLHFELCYYQAIDYVIARGMERVEAGAQGGHKIERGYEPVPTWSAHIFAHSGLHEAGERFARDEARAMQGEMRAIAAMTPFRHDTGEGEAAHGL